MVVTHRPPEDAAEKWPRTTFVSDVEFAMKQASDTAGGKDVTVATANVAQQYLRRGLLDEVRVSLVPVLFGTGVE